MLALGRQGGSGVFSMANGVVFVGETAWLSIAMVVYLSVFVYFVSLMRSMFSGQRCGL